MGRASEITYRVPLNSISRRLRARGGFDILELEVGGASPTRKPISVLVWQSIDMRGRKQARVGQSKGHQGHIKASQALIPFVGFYYQKQVSERIFD